MKLFFPTEFLFEPVWRELQQLWCDSNIQWPLFGSFFSHQGECPDSCPELLPLLLNSPHSWPAGCSGFLGFCFIFQNISWPHCDHFFIVSQFVNCQEQTSLQTKWHYEKQTLHIGTSAKQMGIWRRKKEGKNFFGKIGMALLYTKRCSVL